MTITVTLDLGYEMSVKAPIKQVFDLLSDVPRSASHFPKLERLTDLGGGVYRWEMENVGTPQMPIQTVYASKYVANRRKGTVVWTPVKGQGNASVAGSWKMTDHKTHTGIEFRVQGSVDVPLPVMMTMLVAPMVRTEFERLIEQYLDELVDVFGGEVED